MDVSKSNLNRVKHAIQARAATVQPAPRPETKEGATCPICKGDNTYFDHDINYWICRERFSHPEHLKIPDSFVLDESTALTHADDIPLVKINAYRRAQIIKEMKEMQHGYDNQNRSSDAHGDNNAG